MPPGSTVHYRWELQDANGERLNSRERSFEYVDSRFTWEQISGGDLSCPLLP
jgi:hypothetical protein